MKPMMIVAIAATGLVALTGCGRGCNTLIRKGSGHVTTQTRNVSPFSKITLEGIFGAELSQTGDSEWVKVQTDDNLQNDITVENEGDRVVIKTTDSASIGRSTKMRIYINVKKLTELDFNSVGSLSSADTLKLDSLSISSESVGKLDLDIDAKYLHAGLESVGNTTLSGKVNEVRINNKGIGALHAFGLKANTLMIHNTGVGVVEVYADSAFYIRSSSIGALYYKGPGEVKELKSEGIGKVQKSE